MASHGGLQEQTPTLSPSSICPPPTLALSPSFISSAVIVPLPSLSMAVNTALRPSISGAGRLSAMIWGGVWVAEAWGACAARPAPRRRCASPRKCLLSGLAHPLNSPIRPAYPIARWPIQQAIQQPIHAHLERLLLELVHGSKAACPLPTQ